MRADGANGFAIAIVLLVSIIALGAAVSTATLAGVSARRVASNEQSSTAALFAAESGLNSLLARPRTTTYAYDEDVHSSVDQWLTAVGLDSYELPQGSRVELDVVAEAGGLVTIRAEGTASDGASRVIFQDFVRDSTEVDASLFSDAALLTKDAPTTKSRNSKLMGRGITVDDWEFPNRELADARVGEYVEMSGELYRVDTRNGDGTATLHNMTDGTNGNYSMSTIVTLLPFALTSDVSSFANPTTLTITDSDLYEPGTDIAIGSGEGTVVARRDGEIDVDWTVNPSETTLLEGSPIRRLIPSAIADGGCPEGSHIDEKLPQGCVEEDLGDLWANTFAGMSKTDLRDIAVDQGNYYSGGAWPSSVSGVTWIDGARTRGKNNELCGEGVVILNTGSSLEDEPDSLNLTTADCDFKGVLFVIGQLKLVGNLDNMAGAIVVEGPGVTEVQGTGDKSLFDPIAVRDALEQVPPVIIETGLHAVVPNSLRFGR